MTSDISTLKSWLEAQLLIFQQFTNPIHFLQIVPPSFVLITPSSSEERRWVTTSLTQLALGITRRKGGLAKCSERIITHARGTSHPGRKKGGGSSWRGNTG